MNRTSFLQWVLGMGLLGLLAPAARAQWLTQSFVVKPGWTAVYLHVDPRTALSGYSLVRNRALIDMKLTGR
jgi:hypothetical protein